LYIIRIDKSANRRVIVSSPEVVEPGLRIVIIPAIANGIQSTDAIHIYGDGAIAPGIIDVFGFKVAAGIVYCCYVSLQVLLVVICTTP